MTQTPLAPPSPDDIVLEDEGLTQRLDRAADALIAEADAAEIAGDDAPRVTSVRQAVRDDAALVRDKVAGRVDSARDTIRDQPMKATLYALGVGVLLGMLLRR